VNLFKSCQIISTIKLFTIQVITVIYSPTFINFESQYYFEAEFYKFCSLGYNNILG